MKISIIVITISFIILAIVGILKEQETAITIGIAGASFSLSISND